MAGCFKNYDIRGKYKIDLDEKTAYKIGYFLPRLLETDKILVGRDGRISSPSLYAALCDGITANGADVFNLGIATTPMVYYFTEKLGFDCSVQITASHNSKEYNGFKVSRTHARPVGYDNGLSILEKWVENEEIIISETRGKVHDLDMKQEYIRFMKSKLPDISNLKIVIDCSNGAACIAAREIFGDNVICLNGELDGEFPAHEPNPLDEKNARQLKDAVKEYNADVGVLFDGDGDRVVFIDEKGQFISPDLITAVLAEECTEPGDTVIYDIRTSRSVDKHLREMGRSTYMWRVGRVHATEKLRELSAVLGGELAGHYYFKEFIYCDSGILAATAVFKRLSKGDKAFSEIIKEIACYAYSGEINFKIKNKSAAMTALLDMAQEKEIPLHIYDFDGYRVEYENRWFNIRASNTEDYLRLVAEAGTEGLLTEMLWEIKKVLAEFE